MQIKKPPDFLAVTDPAFPLHDPLFGGVGEGAIAILGHPSHHFEMDNIISITAYFFSFRT